MDIEKLKKTLILHEGKIGKVYVDSVGLKTAGIGHLLTGADTKLAIGTIVSETQISNWFAADIKTATDVANKFLDKIEINEERRAAIINMSFNLGGRIHQFKKFREALVSKQYDKAATEMLSSLWAKQVGNRAKELAAVIRG